MDSLYSTFQLIMPFINTISGSEYNLGEFLVHTELCRMLHLCFINMRHGGGARKCEHPCVPAPCRPIVNAQSGRCTMGADKFVDVMNVQKVFVIVYYTNYDSCFW